MASSRTGSDFVKQLEGALGISSADLLNPYAFLLGLQDDFSGLVTAPQQSRKAHNG